MIEVRSAGAAAFLTTPLLAFAGFLPWMGHELPRLGWVPLPVLALLCAAAYCFVRPRRRLVPLDAAASLRLDAVDESDEPVFRVLVSRAGREEVLLEHPSFSVVARDLGRILDAIALPLQSAHVPAAYFRSSGRQLAGVSPVVVSGVPSNAHVRSWRGTLGGAAFAAMVLGWSLVDARSPHSAISVALAVAGVFGVALFGTWLMTLRVVASVSKDGLVAEQIALGRRRKILAIARHDLLGAWLVHCGSWPSHVLFATAQGPRVLELMGDPARDLAQAVGRLTTTESRIEPSSAALPGGRTEISESGVAAREAGAESRRDPRRVNRPEMFRAR